MNHAPRTNRAAGSRLLWLIALAAVGLFAVSAFLALNAGRHAVAIAEERRRADEMAAEARRQQEMAEAAHAEAENRAQQSRQLVDQARGEVRLVRARLYDLHLRLAQAAWEEGRINDVLENLELERPRAGEHDLRGFEWYYWNRLCHRDRMTLKGPARGIRRMILSSDGARIAAAGDGMVIIWDAVTGDEQHTFNVEHERGGVVVIQALAFSPDGKWIAFTGPDLAVTVRDVANGTEAITLREFEMELDTLAFSPDGATMATSNSTSENEQLIKLWDLPSRTTRLTFKGHKSKICRIAFSPDGNRLATASLDGTAKVWDAATGQELLTFSRHTDAVHALVFSPDGQRIATGSWDMTVKVWDAVTGTEIHTLKGHTGSIWDVAYSRDGTRIASTAASGENAHAVDDTIRVWDAGSGEEISVLRGHTGIVVSVVFSPDGRQIISASGDGTVKVWDTPTRPDLPIFADDGAGMPHRMTISPDSSRVVTANEIKSIRVWDTDAGRQVMKLAGDVFAMAPDGSRIAVPDEGKHTVTIWNTADGIQAFELDGHTAPINDVVFSPDKAHIASASNDGTVKLWDSVTGREIRTLRGHSGRVNAVDFSPDGTLIASGADDLMVKLWDTNSGLEKFTLAGHTKPVTRLTFSQDGTRIASYGTGDWRWMAEVKLWDAITGREIAIDGYDEKARGLRLEFSPDGKQFVFCGAGLETLRVLDAATGKQLFAIQAPGEGNWTVAWSPDGSRLASASSYSAQWAPEDSTVKLWDVATGEETVSLKGQWGIPARLAFSRNGERLISAGSIGTVKIWEAPRGNRETDGN